MRTSGPTVAKTSSAQISQPSVQSWSLVCGIAESAISTHVHGMTTALTRDGEYVCMSGATATEYAAQVAQIARPRRIPRVAAGDLAARPDRDERDADERNRRSDPEAAG